MGALAFALKVIEMVPFAVDAVSGAWDAFQWGSEKVKAMVAEDRDPTDAEWDELNAKVAALRTALHTD